MLTDDQRRRLDALHAEAPDGLVLVLTGAGISAESGIPTFRGPEGYWTIGSREYHPQELATWAAFKHQPEEIWSWYLYRRALCRAARPNPAHLALVELEQALGDRFRLVTQNVDGLHIRAGNSLARTYQIHGDIDLMRCADECQPDLLPVPAALDDWPKTRRVGDAEWELLTCPACGEPTRPHVLWFDESYDEVHYRWQSSMRAAEQAALLLVVGTSGATNLPDRIVREVARRQRPLIVANLDSSPFSEIAERSTRGLNLVGTAGELVPGIAAVLRGKG